MASYLVLPLCLVKGWQKSSSPGDHVEGSTVLTSPQDTVPRPLLDVPPQLLARWLAHDQ